MLPEVAAIAETLPGHVVNHWYAIRGPKGMPVPIVMRWNKEVACVLQGDDLCGQLRVEGLEPKGWPLEELRAVLKEAVDIWRRVITQAGIACGE